MTTEEWRAVSGFPCYEVSSLGNVRSWKKNRWGRSDTPRLLRPGIAKNGYPLVVLNGTKPSGKWFSRSTYVHRLVTEAFLGPKPIGHEVNHINSDRADARASNLEYVTSSENNTHAIRYGRMKPPPASPGRANVNAKLTEELVAEIRASADTHTAIAKRLGLSVSSICSARRRQTWKHVP
jgi:hypothetical protein